MQGTTSTETSRPLGYARYLSWTSLVLILATTLFLSVVIANSARKTLLTKQQEFALLLADNLNHQIFQRFTLPTLIGFGRIALKQEQQYERLGQVIETTIHGQGVTDLKIFDFERRVSFALDEQTLGQTDLAGVAVDRAFAEGEYSFDIKTDISPLEAMFTWDNKPGSVVLTIVYPLRAERGLDFRESTLLMGVMELSQDITDDYRAVINFQWLIIGVSLSSSLALFLVLFMIIRHADRITVERMAEKERLERDLHQSERLASMGRMVAGVAHEIRNPLGIIRSSAELLLRSAESSEDAKQQRHARILKAIHDEGLRLSRTVNDFLDYARPKEPKRELVNLARVVEQAHGFLEGEFAKHGVSLDVSGVSDMVVLGDKDLLYRALYNVLVNAQQAMTAGPESANEGACEVGVPEQAAGCLITIRTQREGKRGLLIVTDTGPGFSPEAQGKMMDPFFTTKDEGTGLGLAIVRNIVESHGGEVLLDNAPTGGARARLRFPLAEAAGSGKEG